MGVDTASGSSAGGLLGDLDLGDHGLARGAGGRLHDQREILPGLSAVERKAVEEGTQKATAIHRKMTSDQDYFHLTSVLDAYEGQVRVFTKSWTRKIRREMV
jgi:hypothetical protein